MRGVRADAAAGIEDPLAPAELERTAQELATLAGRVIAEATTRLVVVGYKDRGNAVAAPRDPVTEVDRAVEDLIREGVAAAFPQHGFLGEESGNTGAADADYVWVVDPIDGTQNFVNGLPFFGCAIGVLRRGEPVAGAVWCATTHALRPGVYHASEGGPLRFDGEDLNGPARATSGRLRAVSSAPMGSSRSAARWDHRSLGASVVECAFVAAGLLATAHARSPHAWDVAAALALARAAGCEVWTRPASGWERLHAFPADRQALARWQQPIYVVGSAEVGRSGPPAE